MKKKIVAIAMAAAMMASLSSLAFAAENTLNGTTQTGTTDISYAFTPAYSVSIPATLEVSDTDADAALAISASGLFLEANKEIQISISDVTDGSLILNNGSNTFSVKLKVDGAELTSGKVATFTENKTANLTLSYTAKPQYAGTYSKNVSFTLLYTDTTA